MVRTLIHLAAFIVAIAGLAEGAATRGAERVSATGIETDEIAQVVPRFVEETESAGVDSVYAGGWQYMVGGGVATFDCNADGFPNMLLAGGEAPAKFYRNISSRG